MARTRNRLTAVEVAAKAKRGYYCDGGGLYLQVTPRGKSWVFRYQRNGRCREMGLGPAADVTLAKARRKAAEARALLADGKDALSEKHASLAAARAVPAFRECAERYIAAHAPGWRNSKHRQQWENTLASYAYPTIGDLSVAAINTALVLRVLEPIWAAKTETASRLRGRIEAVLDWAAVRGMRTGENPARWRGHLDKLLPKRARVAPVKHLPAMAYAEVPDFLVALRWQPGIAARALEFAILTAARTGEVIGAKWDEFAGEIWTIPAARMKAGRKHRVPLSARALAIIEEMHRVKTGEFVFPGRASGQGLEHHGLTALLKRMQRNDITAHGFRSSFRDWAGERTAFPREVIEHALAHRLRDKAEAAYARGDLFVKRVRLMQAWSDYCATPSRKGEVVALAQR